MSKNHDSMPVTLLDQLHTTGAGYDVIRYIGLPDIFGQESPTLLYFMGKNLSRKLDIQTVSDVVYAFDKLGWGQLELVKEKKNELIFQLMADSVVYRLNAPLYTDFRLEAGFLSESIERIKERSCECKEELYEKIHQIEFTVVFTD
ncbi:MAG TPA: YslB family protein [Lentibacillus sp.]|uniref:YslB family protein n=1 Tax=Lentibacillus sp. TaxID=1925746 RepID=UPI002B4AF3D5|nr:YslB family protein [Lentibacillus sp.]HLR62639.1 YslB family protein [Lentibacillus sp.]